jgi:DNA gyrase subunit A
MSASELVPLEPGERVIGLAPLARPHLGGSGPESAEAGPGVAGLPGLALGTRRGVVKVCAPEWPVRSDVFEVIGLKDGDEVVGAAWLADGTETLVFISSDASLLRFSAQAVRPQGLKGGGMAGINLAADAQVLFFGAVRTDDPQHGEPMVVTSSGSSVKVSPFKLYPAKGRATGGVRAQRFLKGESRLTVAWAGPRPAAATDIGDPIELPTVDVRRDGSGSPVILVGPDLVGHLIERD